VAGRDHLPSPRWLVRSPPSPLPVPASFLSVLLLPSKLLIMFPALVRIRQRLKGFL
jgi:hypothetical protein